MGQTYPGADRDAQWFADRYPGSRMTTNCGVIHTTETSTWPGYGGGATAPNATGRPNTRGKRIDWREHYPTDRSSRALRNLAGGVETNTANAVQLELVGTCDPTYRKSRREWGVAGRDYIYWPDAPDWALKALGQRLAWYAKEHGIPLATPRRGRWTAYPQSYGPGKHRLSHAEWRNLRGWVGHQGVPENTHGDPGSLNIDRVLWHARQALKPPPKKRPVVQAYYRGAPGSRWLRPGMRGDDVKVAKRALGLPGTLGVYNSSFAKYVVAFKKKHGLKPANNIVGPATWKKLLEVGSR